MTIEEGQKSKAKIPVAYDLTSHHAEALILKFDVACNCLSSTARFIHVQPNSSPHIGTLCSLGLAFVVARRLQDLGLDVVVRCDLWDQARGEQKEINGTQYYLPAKLTTHWTIPAIFT